MGGQNNEDGGFWVFGYGSLCWHPGFEYKRSLVGYVRGFARRFWQGNTTHRGTVEKPGRVATLIEEKEGIVYGRAFHVHDRVALPYLEKRECTLGGYTTTISTFYSREGQKSIPVIIYIATNKNEHWLGEASLHNIARQISECSGPSGHNVEYLFRLADFMRRYLPEAPDEHLFTLELLVRSRIKEMNMCLRTLMGDRDFAIDLNDEEDELADDDVANNNLRENVFQFILEIPNKGQRCLKI
ncbi:putative glutathione-specific gamma-glutamylcyclotransferase 2 [Calliopsis andreniformis]|uniref:putative glutathione-specific gamma-glutamylcyclotransferase 2 n=1 Tax=Calliopsis andreniformis TaxID=337506 RepID=UPI003FCD92AB